MPQYSAFISAKMPLHVEPQVTANFMFNTKILETANGAEQRIPTNLEYLTELSFSDLKYKDCQQTTDLEDFKTFFATQAKGSLNTFLFKNPLDYTISNNSKQTGADTVIKTLILGTGTPEYRILIKSYKFGSVTGYKSIFFVDFDNTVVGTTSQGVVTNASMVNGLLYIPGALLADEVFITGEFYNEYYFDSDILKISRKSSNVTTISGIRLIEKPKPSQGVYTQADFNPVAATFNLGFQPTYDEDFSIGAYRESLENKRTLTTARMMENKSEITLDGDRLICDEKDNLLAMFVACKGRLLDFDYQASRHRFNTDSLSLTNQVINKAVNKGA
ncbi:MAG: DUF2460 domain-containing protein [Waterburya sp.]